MTKNAAAATTNVRPIATAVHRTIRGKFIRALGGSFIESPAGRQKFNTPENEKGQIIGTGEPEWPINMACMP